MMKPVRTYATLGLLTAIMALTQISTAVNWTDRPDDDLFTCIGSLTHVTKDDGGFAEIDVDVGGHSGFALALNEDRQDAAFFQYLSHTGPNDNPISVEYLLTGYTSQIACNVCGCPENAEFLQWMREVGQHVAAEGTIPFDLLSSPPTCPIP